MKQTFVSLILVVMVLFVTVASVQAAVIADPNVPHVMVGSVTSKMVGGTANDLASHDTRVTFATKALCDAGLASWIALPQFNLDGRNVTTNREGFCAQVIQGVPPVAP